MLEIIQQAIKPHDKYQVEVKLDYELLEDQDTHYRDSTYIFIPQSLGITKHNYQNHYFYRDVQTYIRLKTPSVSLAALSEGRNMPLAAIDRIIQTDNWNQDAKLKEQLINNFKLLSVILKSTFRELLILIDIRIKEAATRKQSQPLIANLIEEFIMRNEQIVARYRSYFADFNLPHVTNDVFTAYTLIDESISLHIEEGAIDMYQIVVKCYGAQHDYISRLSNMISQEIAHRQARGYDLILHGGKENETYIYRSSILKKYAASVLYLSTAVRREGSTREQVLFALAAGIAMIFATIVAFYFQQKYGSFTFPVFAALVVGYMFKDRIKEFSRDLLAARWLEQLYDRRIEIRSLNGEHKLGYMREKVNFVREKDVPRPVIRARNKDFFIDLENDGQEEMIICYKKEIVLHAPAFKKAFAGFPPITGLNDIIRYDVRAYLNKMADPTEQKLYLEDDQLKSVTCHKVYYLNLVSRYRSIQPTKEKLHRRTQLVLTRKGIKRVEEISI